jgi:hypothetical protein
MAEKTRRPAVRLALIAAIPLSVLAVLWLVAATRTTDEPGSAYASPTPCQRWKAPPSWGAGSMRPYTGGRSQW